MKIVIGNYSDPNDNRNLILNENIKDHDTGENISSLITLITSVSGIDTPPYRNGTGDWSGADGGYLGTQLYGAREIGISGVYVDRSANCDYSNSSTEQFTHVARMYIRSRLPIRVKQTIRIFLDNGMTFFTEGYCTDLKMEYTYSGHGDYRITMYCPDPALYRGFRNGTLNSEWNTAPITKGNSVGYNSSWKEDGDLLHATMTQGVDNVGAFIPNHHYTTSDIIVYGEKSGERHLYSPKTTFVSGDEFDESDWNEQPELGINEGVEWIQGGRSTAIRYTGDLPCYPKLIVELGEDDHCVNPSFYSVNQNKTFSLGYPDTRIAVFQVSSVDSDGGVTGIEIIEPGSYDANFSARDVQMQNYMVVNRGYPQVGYGCTLDLTATQNEDGTWSFTSAEVRNPGAGYVSEEFGEKDEITPLIAGAALFQLSGSHKLVVDMDEHTVMVYSGVNFQQKESFSYYITPGSEWFQLDPLSTNNIVFSSANSSDTRNAIIQWRNGYAGI